MAPAELPSALWLAAPEDLLPSLWTSSVGESTKHLVKQLDPKYPFTSEQIALREAIGQRLQAGFRSIGNPIVDCQLPLFSSRSSSH